MNGFYLINTNVNNTRAHTHQILKTIESLIDAGTKIDLVAPKYDSVDVNKISDRHKLSNNFEFILIKNFLFKKPSFWSFVLFNLKTVSFLFKKKIDFIYFRSEFFILTAMFLRLFKIPYFYELHRDSENVMGSVLRRTLIKHSKGVVVISNSLKEQFSYLNSNIIVAHDAVNLEMFDIELSKTEAREKLRIPTDEKVVMYTGTVSLRKGVDMVLKAATILSEYSFYLVGPVSSGIRDMGKGISNVYFIGNVDQSVIPMYLKAADLLILPHPDSIYSQSPMKLFEYIVSNRPILSADLANISEVSDGVEGMFSYKSGDVIDFTENISSLFSDEVKMENFGDRNNERYSWRNRGVLISEFLKDTNHEGC